MNGYTLREVKPTGSLETLHVNLASAVQYATNNKMDMFRVTSPSGQTIYSSTARAIETRAERIAREFQEWLAVNAEVI